MEEEEITPEELDELLEEGADVEVIDIRPEANFRQAHIPGSVNVPFVMLPKRVEEFDGAETVVTVCPHGKASLQAARLVRSYEGIPDDARVASLAGGLEAWEYGLAADEETQLDDEVDDEENESRPPF